MLGWGGVSAWGLTPCPPYTESQKLVKTLPCRNYVADGKNYVGKGAWLPCWLPTDWLQGTQTRKYISKGIYRDLIPSAEVQNRNVSGTTKWTQNALTGMHSSRMLTARFSSRLGGGVCLGGYLPGGGGVSTYWVQGSHST